MADGTQLPHHQALYLSEGKRPLVLSHGGYLAPSPRWKDRPDWSQIIQARQSAWCEAGLSLDHSIWVCQVHSNDVWQVTDADMGSGAYHDAEVAADAMVCAEPHPQMNLVMKAADCGVMGLRCRSSGVIAVVHAGHRGQRNGIIPKTIRQMVLLGAHRDDIEVYVGPMITSAAYVHPRYGDVVAHYVERSCGYRSDAGWHIDQEAMIRRILYNEGINPDTTFFDGRCTYADPELLSHREMEERMQGHLDAGFQRGNHVLLWTAAGLSG